MTYKELKLTTKAFLANDFQLPQDDELVKALLKMAYKYIANKCQVLNLQTLDKSANITRLGRGGMLVRLPDLPKSDEDELDIDDDLGYVACNLIASYMSEKRFSLFQSKADEIIRDYNAKVDELIETYALNAGIEK